jgi:hypothetical protein
MALRNRAKPKLGTPVAELDKMRLQDRYCGLGIGRVSEAPLREPCRIVGEVQGLRVVPRAGSPSLEVTVSDGTGRAVAVFLGRKRLAGLDPGRGVILEGVARREGNRTILLNPAYTLLPH